MAKPSTVKEIQIKWNNFLPFSGYFAMTLFGKMWVRKSKKWKWETYIKYGLSDFILNHEMIHVRQAVSTNNSWWKFYLLYVWEWIKANPIFNGFNFAYKMNPFELEAYANERNLNYNIDNEIADQWKKFKNLKVKERKKLWKEFKQTNMTFNTFVLRNIIPLLDE